MDQVAMWERSIFDFRPAKAPATKTRFGIVYSTLAESPPTRISPALAVS